MSLVATKPLRKKFTVEEYHKLGEVGIIGPDERTELIDGDIILMAPMGSRHFSRLIRLDRIFSKLLNDSAFVVMQGPVRLNGQFEPEPDISILKPRDDDYEDRLPQPQDVHLLIEVSVTTVGYDRNIKSVRYSQAGILELWIVDINAELVEVYRNPSVNGYESIQQFRRGDTISPLAFPDIAISVDDIL